MVEVSERKQFCLKCQRRVDLDADIGAVELEGKAGVMCGGDVDQMIAEIFVRHTKSIAWQKMPSKFRSTEMRGDLL